MRVRRADKGTLAPAEKMKNGWLRVEGRSARTGILEYENPDGTIRRELVLPEELFSKKSLDSGRMVPVVSPHPPELLDAVTAPIYSVGAVGESFRQDDEFLVAPMMVTNGATVEAIEKGRVELSWGYDCDIDPPDPSLFAKWGKHDGIQRNRALNHLAIVDKARAGDDARIRLDADGNAPTFASGGNSVVPIGTSQENVMPEPTIPQQRVIRIDGVDYPSTDPGLEKAIERMAQQIRADGAQQTLAATERADALLVVAERMKAHALQRGAIARKVIAKLDSMKSMKVGCDECGGTGKTMDGGEERTCGYCDGEGATLFHSAMKGAPPAAGGEQDDDAYDAEMPPLEMTDDEDLERDDPEEEETEKAANAQHHDAAKKARAEARKKRSDSIARMVERRALARAALVLEAQPHLGTEVKLDGKGDAEIRRMTVAKLAPHVKLDGLSESEIGLLYATETGRVKASAKSALSGADALRAGMVSLPGGRTDGGADADWQKKVDEANRVKNEAWKRPAAK